MKIRHIILSVIISGSLFTSCSLFKTQTKESQLIGSWQLESVNKTPAFKNPEVLKDINKITAEAFRVKYEFQSEGTYVKTTSADREKGVQKISDDGRFLQAGNMRYEIKSFEKDTLKLKKGKYLYTFGRIR